MQTGKNYTNDMKFTIWQEKIMVENIIIQSLTNRVSGRLGHPESGFGQPELEVWLPGGQPTFFYQIFLMDLQSV